MRNRKGFTITELVIVIVVIAILAAVLIPTFGSIVDKANTSANLQEARSIMTQYIAFKDAKPENEYYIQVGEDASAVYFKVENGKLQETTVSKPGKDKVIVSKDVASDDDDWPEVTIVSAG